jgi:hypothetical protein
MGTPPITGRKHSYETVSEAVDDLLKQGYTTDFLIQEEQDNLFNRDKTLSLSPDEFADETIIYAISSELHQVKGLVINSFGADFGYRSSKLVEHLNKHL